MTWKIIQFLERNVSKSTCRNWLKAKPSQANAMAAPHSTAHGWAHCKECTYAQNQLHASDRNNKEPTFLWRCYISSRYKFMRCSFKVYIIVIGFSNVWTFHFITCTLGAFFGFVVRSVWLRDYYRKFNLHEAWVVEHPMLRKRIWMKRFIFAHAHTHTHSIVGQNAQQNIVWFGLKQSWPRISCSVCVCVCIWAFT